MSEMTTRQRASSILSAAKMRMLEESGITVVSREEWYQMQANLAEMRMVLESFSSGSRHRENCAGCMEFTSHTPDCRLNKALQSDAGKAFAERAEALERLYEAVKKERDANEEFARVMNPGGYFAAKENAALKKCEEAQAMVWKVVAELELIDRG